MKENELVNNFLSKYFYSKWKRGEENISIELIINNECDHNCTYCYFKPSSNLDFPKSIQNHTNILINLETFINWLELNNFKIHVSLFGGELLTQNIGYKIIYRLLKSLNILSITVPTNMSFIFYKERIEEVEKILNLDNRLHLSASIDGKYMEENRPLLNGKIRNDEYYAKLFSFCNKYRIGVHPMIYSKGIEKWKDNYLWFKNNFSCIYLLEVRNKNWNKKQIKDFCDFYEFLYLEALKKDGPLYEKLSGENFLLNDLIETNRGIGCSIQQTLHIRLGDLTAFPCHRLMYKGMEYFKLTDSLKIIPMNIELMLMIYSFMSINQPVCESCILKFACSKGCLGAQYENSHDMFMPIQEVCMLKHNKIKTLINISKKTGTYSELLRIVNKNNRNSLRMIEQIVKREDKNE